jgi:hypothetical protein
MDLEDSSPAVWNCLPPSSPAGQRCTLGVDLLVVNVRLLRLSLLELFLQHRIPSSRHILPGFYNASTDQDRPGCFPLKWKGIVSTGINPVLFGILEGMHTGYEFLSGILEARIVSSIFKTINRKKTITSLEFHFLVVSGVHSKSSGNLPRFVFNAKSTKAIFES